MNIEEALNILLENNNSEKLISDVFLVVSEVRKRLTIRIEGSLHEVDLENPQNVEVADFFQKFIESEIKLYKQYLYENYHYDINENFGKKVRVQSLPTIISDSEKAYTAAFRF